MNMYSSLAKHFMHLCTPPRGPEMRQLFFQQLPPDIEYCLRAIFNLQRRNELNSKRWWCFNSKGKWKWIWFSASLLMIKVHDLRKWKKLNLFLRFFSACRQWYHHLSRNKDSPTYNPTKHHPTSDLKFHNLHPTFRLTIQPIFLRTLQLPTAFVSKEIDQYLSNRLRWRRKATKWKNKSSQSHDDIAAPRNRLDWYGKNVRSY